MPRKCGTCSACCRWPSVKEIGKPAKEPCQHLHGQGFRCTIYEDRPKMCADYRCSWIRGKGANKDRPDTCGVLMDRRMTQWGHVLVAKQLEPFSAMTQRGSNALRRAGRDENLLVLVVDFEDAETVIGAAGPQHLVEQFQKETNSQPVPLGTVPQFAERLVERVLSHGG